MTDLTRVQSFGSWAAKRDDEACYVGPEYPSGSKWRQYLAMAERLPGAPMVVGCSAASAMQIYVAAAARHTGARGVVYVPSRRTRTAATEYAASMGAEVCEVRPGYLSVVRMRAKEYARGLPAYVRWDPALAVRDAADQVENVPGDVERIVVPTGSGLTAAGVLVGLAERGRRTRVLVVAVSDLADRAKIIEVARRTFPGVGDGTVLDFMRAPGQYEDHVSASLPDGATLDPYYAAKTLEYVRPGDCLWVPGVRPKRAMPVG
jgi:1-aminocyclopropane-1-carboxylate deaminase/D-cysteine desulfhydrase-like pyridoxal-dependent ACC family enzyme